MWKYKCRGGSYNIVHRVYRVQQLFRSTDEQRLRMIIVRLVYCWSLCSASIPSTRNRRNAWTRNPCPNSYHFGTTKMRIFQRGRKEKEPFFFLNENPRNISMLTRFELKSTFQNTKYEYSYYFGTIKMRIFQRGIKEPFFFFLTKYFRIDVNSIQIKINVPKYQVWIFITRLYNLYKTIPLLVYIYILVLDLDIHTYIYTIHMHRYTIKYTCGTHTRVLAPLHTYTSTMIITVALYQEYPYECERIFT